MLVAWIQFHPFFQMTVYFPNIYYEVVLSLDFCHINLSRTWLQDMPSGSLDVLQLLAYHPMVDMEPTSEIACWKLLGTEDVCILYAAPYMAHKSYWLTMVTFWASTHTKNLKTFFHKDIGTLVLIAALLKMARTWIQPKNPLKDVWIEQMWCTHTMEYYLTKGKIEYYQLWQQG